MEPLCNFLIPEYEAREAARFNLYKWSEWIELDGMDRARCVAYYRIHLSIEEHISHEASKPTVE